MLKPLILQIRQVGLVSINSVTDADDLMIINKSGLTIRMMVSDLRVMGRATQGVRLINIKGNDSIAAVTKVMREEDAVEEGLEELTAEDGENGVTGYIAEAGEDTPATDNEEQQTEE